MSKEERFQGLKEWLALGIPPIFTPVAILMTREDPQCEDVLVVESKLGPAIVAVSVQRRDKRSMTVLSSNEALAGFLERVRQLAVAVVYRQEGQPEYVHLLADVRSYLKRSLSS